VKEAAMLSRDAAHAKDKNIAIAAVRAYGRIGEKVAPVPTFNDPAGTTDYDKWCRWTRCCGSPMPAPFPRAFLPGSHLPFGITRYPRVVETVRTRIGPQESGER
jgi:hypothetical protein